MKKQKMLRALLSLFLAFGIIFMSGQSVSATTTTQNDAVLEARKGIVQVMFAAQNANKEYVDIYGGTGFLIGVEASGAQYVITNHHVVDPFQEEYVDDLEAEQEAVWDFLGIAHDKDIKTKIRIVLKRDTYIDAEIVESSKSTDFAILKLEQPIYGDRKPLTLADSSQLKETEEVYALGFPAIVQAMQDSQLYTSSDVNINNGKVSKLAESVLIDDPIPCINHSATITSGNSGGPLVNANGDVVGLNRHTDATGTYFFSVQINEIAEILDLRGIEYTKAGSSETTETTTEETTEETTETVETTEVEETEDNSALFAELKAQIDEAEEIDTEKMTEESVMYFEDALNNAKDVYDDSSSSADDLEDAMDDLEKAAKGLVEEKTGISPVIIIAIAAVVVILILLIVIVVISSSKRTKEKEEAEKAKMRRAAEQASAAQKNFYDPMSNGKMAMPNDEAVGTSVLNSGSSETTVLSNMPMVYLIRRKNNERIMISKQIFKLGRERKKVDYCVSDNTNVSRTHADIVYRNGEFFIVDNNAANGTTVNGASVAGGQERKLMNNDIIKLADEEFQFRTF